MWGCWGRRTCACSSRPHHLLLCKTAATRDVALFVRRGVWELWSSVEPGAGKGVARTESSTELRKYIYSPANQVGVGKAGFVWETFNEHNTVMSYDSTKRSPALLSMNWRCY